MRKTYRPKKQAETKTIFLRNHAIRIPEMVVIDDKGVNHGLITKEEALKKAQESELDLVLVSPKANPPVAKLLDFGKFQYQQEKILQKQKAKQKKVEVKGVRLSLRIGKHDKDIRIEQSKKFLAKGDKVKFELTLRGRELQHTDLAVKIIKEMIDTIAQEIPVELEAPIERQGGKLTVLITSKGK